MDEWKEDKSAGSQDPKEPTFAWDEDNMYL